MSWTPSRSSPPAPAAPRVITVESPLLHRAPDRPTPTPNRTAQPHQPAVPPPQARPIAIARALTLAPTDGPSASDSASSPRYAALQSPHPIAQRRLFQSQLADEQVTFLSTADAPSGAAAADPSSKVSSSSSSPSAPGGGDGAGDHPDGGEPGCCDRCCTCFCRCCCTPKCQMCTILCCFCCLTVCGCRDKVCQRMVFFPPVPFYSFDERPAANGQQTLWLVENGKRIEPYTSANLKMAYVDTKKHSTICTMWLRFPHATTTVLFSHGNATDLGCMRDHLIDFARQLKVNVFAYDYTGYGLSSGVPTVGDTLADAEAAYSYLLKTYPQEAQRVIVYGQSLGSAPTTHLARHRRVSGVVIHSGIMSCLRVLDSGQPSTKWFDVFANVDLMPHVRAPVFIMHGTEDKEIPIVHGRTLASLPPNAFKPWWVEGAGHNDIEVEYREAYFAKLEGFVRFVEHSANTLEDTEDPLLPAPSAGVQRRASGADKKAAVAMSNQGASSSSSSAAAASAQPLRKAKAPAQQQQQQQQQRQQQQQQQPNGKRSDRPPSKADFDSV